jgi:ubiquinone/menaquinone biosynthesis C-methylase UbiE
LLPLHNWATFELDVLLHPYVEGGSLLEIGCGSGMYLDLMRALGWRRVVGVDIGATAIQQAKDVLDIEAYCGSLEEAHLDSNSFDAVSLSHTLEHIPEVVEFLREVYRVTRPGGRLAVIVPNIASRGARKFGADWFHLDSPRHTVNFNRRSLSMVLERAGFRVETLKTNPRMAYQTALFSMVRKAGGDRAVYTDSGHRFPIHRRARAFVLSMIERMQCAMGLSAGEELTAVAVKPL